jgi:hypothetical protein
MYVVSEILYLRIILKVLFKKKSKTFFGLNLNWIGFALILILPVQSCSQSYDCLIHSYNFVVG